MPDTHYHLLGERRFLPFFITQALGAFNDNVYKTSLFMIFSYQFAKGSTDATVLTNLSAVIFILPFFLFSAIAGQIAEKYEKSMLIRRVKLFEVIIMSCAAIGFYFSNIYIMLVILFLMGFQSSLFGPIKYGLLPQHLHDNELVTGNGLIQMSTFLSILLGNILGGLLANVASIGTDIVAGLVLVLAFIGYLSSRFIPNTPATAPDIKLKFNIVKETYKNMKYLTQHREIFLAVLGISWLWFFGATILAQITNFTKYTLNGDGNVATMVLASFTLGIGLGSLLCAKLSRNKVEIGLVPLGAIGMTAATLDLFFSHNLVGEGIEQTIYQFVESFNNIRALIDMTLIGLFGGFFIVPLYSMIQQRCEPERLSRVIAGNNILNALFMVGSGIFAIVLVTLGFTVPELLLALAIINTLVSIYIFRLVPEFVMRFLVWVFISLFYRIRISNLEKIPESGGCVLVCNHVSFMDALVIAGICQRPVRFVMDHRIFKTPFLNFIFTTAGAIPIASEKDSPELKQKAFERIAEYLADDEVVCIFPEGKITQDGEINPFKSGIESIIQQTPVPVIPLALQGLWGSFFSRKDGPAMSSIPKRFWSKIGVQVGVPFQAEEVSAQTLEIEVAKLRGDWR